MDPELPEELPEEEAVGRRVSCGEERATVRYVGPVPPTEGVWLGVEWDNPDRGKHDGAHGGVQYFTCSPGCGSFVRPQKVSFGLDFVSVVQQVYDTDTEQILKEDIYFSSKRLEWDHLKAPSLYSSTSILLNRCDVNGAGEKEAIRRTTPNVQWLDLSRTLIGRWEDAAAITVQMEALDRLQLSFNRLQLTSEPALLSGSFRCLKTLILSHCALCWSQVLHCAPMWPQLEELGLEGNNICNLSNPGPDLFQTLKTLNLAQNALQQDSVLELAFLPRLVELCLSETGLTSIHFSDAAPGTQTQMFAGLCSLNLDQNHVSEWCVIDQLDKLSSLTQFSVRGNRLKAPDGKHSTTKQLLIAKMRRLQLLNSCKIGPEERRGAELDYMKLFGEAWLKAGGRSQPSPDFITDHPRYQDLVHKYGAPEEGELKKQQQFALKNHLLKIGFEFPDDSERKRLEKKLPASMEVQKVKGLIHRLLKVSTTDLQLTYTSPKTLDTEFLLDKDLQSLDFHSVKDGDTVLVRWS